MAWSTPRVWAVSELLTAAHMNTFISDNLTYLYSAIAAEFELFGSSMWPSNTNGCAGSTKTEMATNKNYFNWMQFTNGVKSYAECTLPAMPDDYNGGTITAKFVWAANSSSTNSVIWGLQGTTYADGDALDAAFGTAQEVTDPNQAAYKRQISGVTAAITLAGTPAAGQMAQFRIYRLGSGSDNLAVPAFLFGAIINYTRS